jgi:uncharacterized protein YuzE
MHVTYDPEADALYFQFTDTEFKESVDVAPGVVADLDPKGEFIGLEILDVRHRLGCEPPESVMVERLVGDDDDEDWEVELSPGSEETTARSAPAP